jgi:hypothetical protein
MKLMTRIAIACAAGMLAAVNANAAFTYYTGSAYNTASSQMLNARVGFDIVAGNLVVRLENLGGPSSVNSDVLTAVMFNLSGVTLTPISGVTMGGFYGTGAEQAKVGGNWSYQAGLTMPTGRFTGANVGISSTGLGIFDSNGGTRFGTPAENLNGPSYGIAKAPVNANSDPFVLDWLEFSFTINSGTVDVNNMNSVYFQWGTGLNEPGSDQIVPEPTTVVAGALLLLPLGASAVRILRKNRNA